jgi:hypothetical protein
VDIGRNKPIGVYRFLGGPYGSAREWGQVFLKLRPEAEGVALQRREEGRGKC